MTMERTSSQNINSGYFNRFVTISTFLNDKGVSGSSSKMTLVGTALNIGEKMKIYPQVLTFFIKPIFGHFTLLFCCQKQRNGQN